MSDSEMVIRLLISAVLAAFLVRRYLRGWLGFFWPDLKDHELRVWSGKVFDSKPIRAKLDSTRLSPAARAQHAENTAQLVAMARRAIRGLRYFRDKPNPP